MGKIWLKNYPAGVPAEIDYRQYGSIGALFEASVEKFRDRPAYHNMGKTISFGELDRLSRAFGAWLQARGIGKGARVALMMPNCLQYPACIFGALRAGCTVVNVNPLYTARELEYQLKDSGAEAIVILENFAHVLQAVIARTPIKHVVVAALGDLLGGKGLLVNFVLRKVKKMVPAYELPGAQRFNAMIAEGERGALHAVDVGHEDVAFLQYTGGTTGLSKGAVLTHRNIIAAVLQAEAWFQPALARVGDIRMVNAIAALPLYHIFALTLSLLTMRWGAHMTLIPNPRDVPKLVETLKRRPFHLLPAVNTLFNALLQDPQFRQLDFSSLALSQAGGMAASESTAKLWLKVTGCPMIEGWGMSETCAIGTNNPVINRDFTGTIGLPLPGIAIAIKDDDGNSLPLGTPGEICIQGPNVMTGYYNQPEETTQAFTADGYMRTGDVGIMDERGYTRIVDRKKDMILVSGFNVFPNELENVIAMCPGVLECAAIGVEDAKQGEAIKVFVVRSDPILREEDVARYCHDNLTGYKRPKYIEFRDELPKTNVGKILRRALRAPA